MTKVIDYRKNDKATLESNTNQEIKEYLDRMNKATAVTLFFLLLSTQYVIFYFTKKGTNVIFR